MKQSTGRFRRCRVGALVALTLCIGAPDAVAGRQSPATPAHAADALTDLEHRWLAAEDNPDALETILASDFVHVLPSGFVTKAEQLAFMRGHPRSRAGETRRFEQLRVRVFGTAGVATGIVLAIEPDGTTRPTAFTDVFAFRNGAWQAVNAQETPLEPRARGGR